MHALPSGETDAVPAHFFTGRMTTRPATSHEDVVASITGCTACRLCLGRTHIVTCRGSTSAKLMLIGEAPGEVEDRTGLPFTGPSGRLLDKLLVRAGVPFNEIYITNAVKCRPPNNRNPTPEELRSCRPYLKRQIEIIQPSCIITAGKIATSAVAETYGQMSVLLTDHYLKYDDRIPVVPIYHPAYLIRRLDDPSAAPLFRDTVARIQRAFEVSQRVDVS